MPTRPLFKNVLLEVPRTIKDFASFIKHKNISSHRGKKIPIIIIPGFLTGDWSTKPMRHYLQNNGFSVYGWNQESNTKFSIKKLQSMYKMIEEISKKHNQKVILIGWSLGGIYARELARLSPNVEKVITIGSPFGNIFSNYITDIYQLVSNQDLKELKMIDVMIRQPINKPSLNIFSKKDGVVHWMSCFMESDPLSKRKQVSSSHMGMGFDPNVFEIMIEYILEK